MDKKRKDHNKILTGAAPLLFWTAVWALAARAVGQELLIPAPSSVLEHLAAIVRDESFFAVIGTSFLRIICGFATGCLTGVVLAALCSLSQVLKAVFSPAVDMISSVPVTSFIILVMLWLRYSLVPVFISALLVMPVIFGNVMTGISQTDPLLIETAKIYRIGPWKALTKLYIPSVLPYFYSGAVTGIGLAWKSGIAAEVLALPKKAIGSGMYYSKLYLETADLFAWTIIVAVFSLALSRLLSFFVKKTAPKAQKAADPKEDCHEA